MDLLKKRSEMQAQVRHPALAVPGPSRDKAPPQGAPSAGPWRRPGVRSTHVRAPVPSRSVCGQ
jgi:hypothetical protein